MQRALGVLSVGLLLGACAEVYQPPETALTFASSAGADVLAVEEILVRASFRSGAALADLNTAKCVLSRGSVRLEITPPVRVNVPIERGVQPPLGLACRTQIGPRVANAKAGYAPLLAEASDATARKRHYPEGMRVVFEQ